MAQGNPLRGGVSLRHSLVDGKNCYEVENALTYCSSAFRKGDKISKINDKKTQDMPPKEFIRMLSLDSPCLTIHKASIDMEEEQCLESDFIHTFKKEETMLNFRLVMVRKERLEAKEENDVELDWESDDTEDEKELVLVSMTETNVAVVRGRGCDPENPCNNCGINECNVSNVVVMAKKSEVTSVCRESTRTSESHKVNVWMSSLITSHVKSDRHVPFSVNVTIYSYRSKITEDEKRKCPVVLNFTGTDHFLKCTTEKGKVVLKIESYENEKLRNISKCDRATWPFVFYMKTERDNNRLFESAEHPDWFIQTVEPGVSVWVGKGLSDQNKDNFCFVLLKKK